MMMLPEQKLYCHRQIACRFLHSPVKNELLILTIPGGPCLSGHYLDPFLSKLAAHLNANVGIIDLPNHGNSVLTPNSLPLTYQRCLEMIITTLSEISEECDNVALFGQSFGARLAFDLMTATDVNLAGVLLTGFPAVFQMSDGLMEKIGALDLEGETILENQEQTFVNNWAKILTLYTYAPLPSDAFAALTSNLKRDGNEQLLDDVPSIENIAEMLKSKSMSYPVAVIQGDVDGVVPDNNIAKLKAILPSAQFYEFANCGHFPMVEREAETLQVFSKTLSNVA